MQQDTKDTGVVGNIILPPKSNFRITAKQFFITYPQCNIDKEDIFKLFKEQYDPEELVVAQELHEDGNPHIHIYIKLKYKLNLKDPRRFDIGEFHPNIQAVRNKNSVIAYIKKDGNTISMSPSETNLRSISVHNCYKRVSDINYYNQLQERLQRISPPEICVVNGETINLKSIDKRRHLWIMGPPNSGKTTWVNDTFGGTEVFMANYGKYPFENYMNEEIIIYDDIEPNKWDLINATNTWKVMKSIGQVRYKEQYWKINQNRFVIVLSNNRLPDDDALRARFKEIVLPRLEANSGN